MQNKKLIMNRTPKEVPVNMHQRVLPARVTAMDDFNNPQVQLFMGDDWIRSWCRELRVTLNFSGMTIVSFYDAMLL